MHVTRAATIATFRFGEMPLYVVNGTLSRGIIRTRAAQSRNIAEWTFAVSVATLVTVLALTAGRPLLERGAHLVGATALAEGLVARADRTALAAGALPLAADAHTVAPTRMYTTLSVPTLSLTVPFVESASVREADMNAALAEGVVRWPGSSRPGEAGETVLLGHSSAPLGYRGSFGNVFARLDDLKAGDALLLIADDGTQIRYRVTGQAAVSPKAAAYEPVREGEGLLLVSCWPVGTSWKRIAVRAERLLP